MKLISENNKFSLSLSLFFGHSSASTALFVLVGAFGLTIKCHTLKLKNCLVWSTQQIFEMHFA